MALLTQYWGLDGLLILFCCFAGIYLYFTRNFNYWKKKGVVEIPPVAFFGNLSSCILARKPLINVLQDMYEAGKDESYVGFYILDKPCLLLRDPELIKYVLIKDFNNFSSKSISSSKSDMVGRLNLFVARNPNWKYIRQKLSPIFTSGRMKRMFDLMLQIDKDMDSYLRSLNLEGDGRPVDTKEICAKFTTDLIGITAYGLKFNSLTDPDALIRKVGRDIFSRNYKRHIEFLSSLLIPTFVNLFGFYIFSKGATNFLRQVFWEAINERIASGVKKADLLDLLIDLKKEQETETQNNSKTCKLEGDALVAQAAVFFTGGFETSSSTMTFTLYELARNIEIQKKLRHEILNTLEENDGKISYETIMSSLPYLDTVISETLRMYPVLPFLDRVAENDYQFPESKLVIQAGTPVIIPMRSIHMDANYFPKPNIFDPERFSSAKKGQIKPNTFFPFGDGPRICIGMRLGLLQTKLGLIHLISKYEFTSCKETLIPLEFDNLNLLTSTQRDIVLNMRKIPTNKIF